MAKRNQLKDILLQNDRKKVETLSSNPNPFLNYILEGKNNNYKPLQYFCISLGPSSTHNGTVVFDRKNFSVSKRKCNRIFSCSKCNYTCGTNTNTKICPNDNSYMYSEGENCPFKIYVLKENKNETTLDFIVCTVDSHNHQKFPYPWRVPKETLESIDEKLIKNPSVSLKP